MKRNFNRAETKSNRAKVKSNRAEVKSNRAEVKTNRAETNHFSAIKKIVCAIIKNICAMKRIVCAMMCWSKQFYYLFTEKKISFSGICKIRRHLARTKTADTCGGWGIERTKRLGRNGKNT
ncbi:MAG: hypothetical protein IKO67_02320 [Bacteroidaceae bacterium]|nr:hypothetical protein [Bacteroidaceae bacterium]